MINCFKWFVKHKMWKCSACSNCNLTMQTTAVFTSNLTANACLMWTIQVLSDLFSKCLNYFSHWLSTIFLQIFFSQKSLRQVFVVVIYYTLHYYAAEKLFGRVVVLQIHRNLTCSSSFWNGGVWNRATSGRFTSKV